MLQQHVSSHVPAFVLLAAIVPTIAPFAAIVRTILQPFHQKFLLLEFSLAGLDYGSLFRQRCSSTLRSQPGALQPLPYGLHPPMLIPFAFMWFGTPVFFAAISIGIITVGSGAIS